jgi:pimeloyl-ACP methyl ester carboxylesterase
MRMAQSVDDPESFDHRFTTTNGVRLHYVEEGQGPLVLLVHGNPYIWYEWRHQIRALADAGYRAVALDLRGFGQSDAPTEVTQYDMFQLVGDLVGLMRALGESSAVIVGHDVGASVAYNAVELRPDLFRALVLVGSGKPPRSAVSPIVQWAQMRAATGKRFYIDYYQEPGIADAEMNADIRRTLRGGLYSVSGSASKDEQWRAFVGDGEVFTDTFVVPEQLPAWLSEQALDYYVSQYERHGFTPLLNVYRNIQRFWELTPFLDGRTISQPSLFIGGTADPGNEHNELVYNQLEDFLPNLREKLRLEGVGHDPPEEDPEAFNRTLLEFLAAV